MKTSLKAVCVVCVALSCVQAQKVPYQVVDTGQTTAFDFRKAIPLPDRKDAYYGQDANYKGHTPDYQKHANGTVTDKVTGLMWTATPVKGKSYAEAMREAESCRVGGYTDWRLPTVKELYSLIQFSGMDPNPMAKSAEGFTPFIDDEVFEFTYGDPAKNERIIDAQYVTSTKYVSTTMGGNPTVFGVNFADGRIKGYPILMHGYAKKFHVLYVRENPAYGKNHFVDNGDGTVTDRATGLTWMKQDSGKGMVWGDALAYAEALKLGGKSDWRLPNAKELQTLVEYSRSPDHTDSPAIDPVFDVTQIKNEAGGKDYPSFWTGTSHARGKGADAAVYISFGRALGYMHFRPGANPILLDVHGAGAQRSDPKTGNPAWFPQGRGPQGDVIRIYNFVRCVRGGKADKARD